MDELIRKSGADAQEAEYLRELEAFSNSARLASIERDFKKALSLRPGTAYVYHIMGDVYGRFKQYEKSAKAYEESIHTETNNSRARTAYARLGETYMRLGRYKDAIDALKLSENKLGASLTEKKIAECQRKLRR